jgi:hypothetical protein
MECTTTTKIQWNKNEKQNWNSKKKIQIKQKNQNEKSHQKQFTKKKLSRDTMTRLNNIMNQNTKGVRLLC